MATQAQLNVIEAARAKLAALSQDKSDKTKWFIDHVSATVQRTVRQRVRLATEYLKNRVVVNISRPVTKRLIGRTVIVTNRSKPGEFPKADTTRLMKDISTHYSTDGHTGYVYFTVDYGLNLELAMNRSFMVKSFNREYDNLIKLLTGPISTR